MRILTLAIFDTKLEVFDFHSDINLQCQHLGDLGKTVKCKSAKFCPKKEKGENDYIFSLFLD